MYCHKNDKNGFISRRNIESWAGYYKYTLYMEQYELNGKWIMILTYRNFPFI